jgi:hypothetical protein
LIAWLKVAVDDADALVQGGAACPARRLGRVARPHNSADRKERMNDGNRLERLRLLCARLERLPASAHRDWILSEVRARAVDVETGVRPRSMRQFDADAAIPPPTTGEPHRATVDSGPPPPKRTAAARTRRPPEPGHFAARAISSPGEAAIPPTPDAPVAGGRAERPDCVDLLGDGGLLCLGEVSPGAAPMDRHTPLPPWARGLRG